MLSICIPVYNCNVHRLVQDMQKQLLEINHPWEIILMDDASGKHYQEINQKLDAENIRYIQLKENIGRACIRNKLAEEAKYPYLIFMDCDSAVCSKNYIKDYLPYCEPMTVCYGGRTYNENPPEKEYYLHWKYGIHREKIPAVIRKKNPNYNFSTNNFLIHKEIFRKVRFNEELKGYGHEDTYFGLELLGKGLTIKHTDNPLIHKELDNNKEFLKKTEEGVKNLYKVDSLLKTKYPEYVNHSKLMRAKNRLDKWKLARFTAQLFRLFRKSMKKNLLGDNPSLTVFDLYKLEILCNIGNKD